jgi:hypothetical protein
LPQQLQNCRASYGAERKQFWISTIEWLFWFSAEDGSIPSCSRFIYLHYPLFTIYNISEYHSCFRWRTPTTVVPPPVPASVKRYSLINRPIEKHPIFPLRVRPWKIPQTLHLLLSRLNPQALNKGKSFRACHIWYGRVLPIFFELIRFG